ncbi:AfsR/SARP family transcriptional regulator [Plantactinospora endophytica]|uniref:SARP family transcriptional regulator n=1 Tax=Plantactinospora endophytica TaxID=673535 RepID=A0ABQ4E1L8_9ACTN|nr:AfsR/SARP family transcriptional regulator [Plantactinospora endophytica]GIG88593.1 SARP family transcriptional regulator [Plantactinospora endophytica]
MPEIWFGVLGPLEVRIAGAAVAVPDGRPRQLLTALLLNANQFVSVESLMDLLWRENEAPPTARKAVQVYMSKLRQLFADVPQVAVRASRHGYRLDVPADALDLRRFRDIAARAAAAPPGSADPDATARLLAEALDLWRGPALAELTGTARGQRLSAALGEERIVATEARLDALLRAGAHRQVAGEAAQLLAEHPLRERLRGQLMIALYRCGRQAEALSVFEAGRQLLREDLGLDPGRELRDLHVAILNGTVEHLVPRVAATANLRPTPLAVQPVVPAQLPTDLPSFVGRTSYLDQLDGLVAAWSGRPSAPLVVSLTGTAGIGKTTLAVHWAHRIRHRFPDGQLYVNLRGFDPGAAPTSPGEAIQGFLDALPAPAGRIPLGLTAQTGLYRSLLADRRVLIVLDNARDAEQIRPLLPGASASLVVVTSRNRLTSLVTAEGAQPVRVDLLTAAESRELLAARLAPHRLAAEPEALDRIVGHCARLPLALAIVAARAATNPEFRLAAIAAELGEARGNLDVFDDGDRATDVRAAFSWSYRTLGPPSQRLFRLLGLHPGGIGTAAGAASLAGVPAERVRPLLTELARAHLITEPTPGRYGMHDLLRAYARELVDGHEPEPARRAAVHRLLDHYLHTAHRANRMLYPYRMSITLPDVAPDVAGERLGDKQQALAWFTDERATLLTAVEYAARNGFDGHSWQLAWTLATFLRRGGYWHGKIAAHRAALEAARRLGDRAGEAHMQRGLGVAYAGMLRYDDAHRHLVLALDLFAELADPVQRADVHHGLAWVCDRQGDHETSLHHSLEALALYRRIADLAGLAATLNSVGWTHARLGNYSEALRYCHESLVLCNEYDDDAYRANACDSLGYTYHQLGEDEKAVEHYRRAVELHRGAGSRYYETRTLTRLGDLFAASGDLGGADRVWREALDILTELDHPDAAEVRAKLDGGALAVPDRAG